MKKLLFLLFALVSITMHGQTANGSETPLEGLIITDPQNISTPVNIATMGADGTVGKASISNLKTTLGYDVLQYTNFSDFPETGQVGKAYIWKAMQQAYYWDGATYKIITDTSKENTANKQNSLVPDGTGTKFPTVDAVLEVLPTNYSKIVYVNATNPNSATIFDLNNPPVTNDNLLKGDVNNLYVGTDASTWVYNTPTLNYITKTPSGSSIFNYAGTLTPAANTTSAITRTGSVTVNKTSTSGGTAIIGSSASKANGEQFNSQSGESILAMSSNVIEAQSGGIGTDFTPAQDFFAVKFTTTPTASFIQGVSLSVKKTVGLADGSFFTVKLYTDNGGIPGTAFGGGGNIYADELLTTYTDISGVIQNVTTPILPNTVYWVVITRTESGGNFVFNATTGTGTTLTGSSASTINTDTGVRLFNIIYARNAYGGHFVGNNSHALWASSLTGVGVRGDSHSHFGGYFTSYSDWGVQGNSTYSGGILGVSVKGAGVGARTSSLNNPALRVDNTNGTDYLTAVLNGRTIITGRTIIGNSIDYGALLDVVGGISRFSGKLFLNAYGVNVSTQDKGYTFDINGSFLKRAFGVTTPYNTLGNGELSIGGRAGGQVPAITTRTNSATLTGFLITAIQNSDVVRTGDADIILKTGFETGSDAIQTLTSSGTALQVLNNTTPLLNIYRDGNVSIGNPPNAGYKLDVQGTGRFTSSLVLSGQTASTVAIFDASKNIISASTATYPSLTELSYGKGVTSPIQAQIDSKANLASPALTGNPTAPTATAGTNTTQIATTAFVLANARPYKVYVALLSQTGTSAPVATVLENTLGGTVVWTRSVAGLYLGTLSGAFTASKTICFSTVSASSIGTPTNVLQSQISRDNSNDVKLAFIQNATGLSDVFTDLNVEIRVYP